MSGVKAKLKVVLQANDTVVAESEDAVLWQRVLLAINKGIGAGCSSLLEDEASPPPEDAGHIPNIPRASDGDDLGRFARAVGISAAIIEGACAPSKTSPYLTLDMHCWNAMKEQTPPRGPGSISPMAVAATLLALWMQTAKLGAATQAEAQKVLGTINLRDANATRSIQQAEWLQGRGGGVIVLNPARAKRAVAIARAFCSQDWKSDLT
ncbi:MAG: hypothetical protein KIS79_14315 [Burkholderiales bacterium]|nr:hypothetical protein [Burkholderiales bacterium]